MATFCIPKFQIDTIRGKLKSGEWEPGKLSQLSSAERRAEFARLIGEKNAKEVNALFESKLLLKNQQLGMINWAKKILGISETAKRDIISKIERLDKAITGAELDTFLEDLVSKRLGFDVSVAEAGQLLNMTKEIADAKLKISPDSPPRSPERIEYGTRLALLREYVEQLKVRGKDLTWQNFLKSPITTISGNLKSMVASLDNSFFGNQGIRVLFSGRYTDIWIKNFLKSFRDIGKQLVGHDAGLPVKADVYSRENAINGRYKDSKLSVGLTTEEAFPSSLPEKIPLLGRLYKASQSAYNNAALRMRADIFDRIIKNAEKRGVEMSRENLLGYGEAANILTGRASLGRWEANADAINMGIFSARFLKSNIDTLTSGLSNSKIRASKPARVEAAKNLLGTVASVAAIMTLANSLYPGSVETDPRSADFGKIKIPVGGGKYARINITGGMNSLVTLASRLVPTTHNGKLGWWFKNAKSGKITELGAEKFGQMTPMDVLYNFAEGKAAPLARVFIDILNQKTFKGEKPTVLGELKQVTVPISVSSAMEMEGVNTPERLLFLITNGLGFGTNVY